MTISIKTLSVAILAIPCFFFSQVSIGKTEINGNSTILDFDDVSTNTKGIILPAVTSLGTTTNGTFLFDTTDKIAKMRQNNVWINLSDGGSSSAVAANNTPELGNGVIIGTTSSPSNGVLVLESPNKALILPKIANPNINVKNAYPGMICYDTVSKSLAIFNGTVWNYWK